jgi:hypothetical protein
MNKRCQFQGGAGLEEKYRPASPCLGDFLVGRSCNEPRQKYCEVCAPFAKKWLSAQNANASYKRDPERLAKITRENRWKRRKAAGRPCPRLGIMVRCKYRDKQGRRGKGCLGKFERKSSSQKFCAVCHKHANADIARNSRRAHLAEIRRRDSDRYKREREAIARGKILAEVRKPESIIQEMIAIYLRLHPEATSNNDVREIFGPVSKSTIRRSRKLAQIDPPKGRPRKSL